MKASFFSFIAAAMLFVTTAASAAVSAEDHGRDLHRLSPHERVQYEQVQRARERQQAIERARWQAQHRHDRAPARPYNHH